MKQHKPHMIVPPMSRLEALRLRQQAIGVRLRWEFEALVLAPVPPEWLELLRKADER